LEQEAEVRLPSLLLNFGRDRRGAVAATFGITALTFFGLVGLATEVGSWYVAHRKAQNAADAAAMAGAITVSASFSSCATGTVQTNTRNTATTVASLNGFATGGDVTVSANCPPASPSAYTGDNSAVQAIISQNQTISFARLFNITSKIVVTTAVAKVIVSGDACVLTLTDPLVLSGNFAARAPNCMFASNNRESRSINIAGSSTVNVQSLHASGGCYGCSSNNVTDGTPYTSGGAPVTNPFAGLESANWSSISNATCLANGNYNSYKSGSVYTLAPFQSNGGNAYCSTFQLTNGETLNLSPGVYFFYNADVRFNGGTVTCSSCSASNGVSIVLLGTGNQVGDLDINASAAVTLTAGTISGTTSGGQALSALNGVLFYRYSAQDDVGGSVEVHINGGASSTLAGGMYFPSADAIYNGNSSSQCTMLVAGAVTMNGDATFDTTTCANIGTPVAKVQSVALVE